MTMKSLWVQLKYQKVVGMVFCKIFNRAFLRLPEKNVFDSNGPYIGTNQTKIRNVCLSVILAFCLLWSVICTARLQHPISAFVEA